MDKGEIIIYYDKTSTSELQVRMVRNTVWLTQLQMSELLGRDKSVISRHISNAVKEGEVELEATVANFATVQIEGEKEVSRDIEYYNLDFITSVGYRVKSLAGVQIRKWAMAILKEYMLKGFTIDDVRLKEPDNDYFEELFERIRDIRS